MFKKINRQSKKKGFCRLEYFQIPDCFFFLIYYYDKKIIKKFQYNMIT